MAMADAGDFDGFYSREGEGVLVFFARRTLDPETALELTAETFSHAYLGWRGLRGDSHAERQAWLYTIARRGMLRLDATHPVLLGAGAPRPLTLDANRAFLAVLPGHDWDAPLRISAVIDGRTVVRSALQSFPGPPAPATPQARAPDPNGGAPWGFAAGADHSTDYGRIVDGRLAVIEARNGSLHDGPDGWSGGGNGPAARKPPPVRFDSNGGPEEGPFGERPTAVPRPEIERRTLPGRTIITGVADAGVVSVTLATPRDVRTLRPSGPQHVLIAVYDGQFFGGEITATVELRDGHTVTEDVPNGPGGNRPPAPPAPSLAKRLQQDRLTLAGMRSLLARAVHPTRAQREKVLHGAPFSQIVQGLRQIEASVAAEEGRIAYLAAHPDVLPLE